MVPVRFALRLPLSFGSVLGYAGYAGDPSVANTLTGAVRSPGSFFIWIGPLGPGDLSIPTSNAVKKVLRLVPPSPLWVTGNPYFCQNRLPEVRCSKQTTRRKVVNTSG